MCQYRCFAVKFEHPAPLTKIGGSLFSTLLIHIPLGLVMCLCVCEVWSECVCVCVCVVWSECVCVRVRVWGMERVWVCVRVWGMERITEKVLVPQWRPSVSTRGPTSPGPLGPGPWGWYGSAQNTDALHKSHPHPPSKENGPAERGNLQSKHGHLLQTGHNVAQKTVQVFPTNYYDLIYEHDSAFVRGLGQEPQSGGVIERTKNETEIVFRKVHIFIITVYNQTHFFGHLHHFDRVSK